MCEAYYNKRNSDVRVQCQILIVVYYYYYAIAFNDYTPVDQFIIAEIIIARIVYTDTYDGLSVTRRDDIERTLYNYITYGERARGMHHYNIIIIFHYLRCNCNVFINPAVARRANFAAAEYGKP